MAVKIQEVDPRLISKICEHAKEGRLVVLVGAGASAGPPRNLPTWYGLISKMAEHTRQYSNAQAEFMEELQKSNDLIGAASVYGDIGNIPKPERARFFLKLFATSSADTTELSREIAKLPVSHWVTTNYDEMLSRELRKSEVSVYGNGDDDLSSAISLWFERASLVHLHGQAHLYDSLAYSKSTYDKISSRESYEHFLREIFVNHSVLALGFGFTDPPFVRTLRFIQEKLSGAGKFEHFAVLPEHSQADTGLLGKSHFNVISYDSEQGHGYVLNFVRALSEATARDRKKGGDAQRAGPTPVDPAPQQAELQLLNTLASIYSAITDPNRKNTYCVAAATVVISVLQDGSADRGDLNHRVAKRLGTSKKEASQLVDAGVEYLQPSGRIGLSDGRFALQEELSKTDDGSIRCVEEAIITRMMSLNRGVEPTDRVSLAVRQVVSYAMMQQGKTLARSFANEDPPASYVLHNVVSAAVRTTRCPIGLRGTMTRAAKEVLAEPTKEVSRALFDLATAAYALERVFLNPLGSDVSAALKWRLFLDSNVAMRMLDPSGDPTGALGALRKRCSRLNTPLYILGPFVEEIVSHAQRLGRTIEKNGVSSQKSLDLYLSSVSRTQVSPLLLWYAAGLPRHQWRSYPGFLRATGIGSKTKLMERLQTLGIIVEGEDAVRRLDTSERETLWAELREWRRHDQDSQGARRLRRAEATQVTWLKQERAVGNRAWFLSRDGQLRRALKYVLGGKYSGYVITPSAWMMRLQELHWGDVDAAGFSELMWLVPQESPAESMKKVAMARVLEREPTLAGKDPEWLRDEIEVRFEKWGSLIEAADASDRAREHEDDSEYEDSAMAGLAEQIVSPTVDEILDELARTGSPDGRG